MPRNLHIQEAKRQLSQQLSQSGYLWSYQTDNQAILSDEELIQKALTHLEFEDMHLLFDIYPYRQIKGVWQRNMLPYDDYYGILNFLLAVFFFHIKNPKKYLKRYEIAKIRK